MYMAVRTHIYLFSCGFIAVKGDKKLTFLYLANDVIQNSKRKGPEFSQEFRSVLGEGYKETARYLI